MWQKRLCGRSTRKWALLPNKKYSERWKSTLRFISNKSQFGLQEQVQHQGQHGGATVFLAIAGQQQKQQHDDEVCRIKIGRQQLTKETTQRLTLVGSWLSAGRRRRRTGRFTWWWGWGWWSWRLTRLRFWLRRFWSCLLHAAPTIGSIGLRHIAVIHSFTSWHSSDLVGSKSR